MDVDCQTAEKDAERIEGERTDRQANLQKIVFVGERWNVQKQKPLENLFGAAWNAEKEVIE